MKEKLKPQVKSVYVIPAVIFILFALSNVISFFGNSIDLFKYGKDIYLGVLIYGLSIISSLLAVIGYGGLAFGVYTNKRNLITVAGALGVAISSVIGIFSSNMSAGLYFWFRTIFINILTAVPSFAVLILVGVSFTDYLPNFKENIKSLWFIPAICCVIINIIYFFVYFISFRGVFGGFLWHISNVFEVVALLLLGMWVAYPDEFSKTS